MAQDRTPRDAETREKTARRTTWRPPSLLPMPNPQDGWEFRYIRSSSFGSQDNVNVSAKIREGWVPVKPSEVPEISVINDVNGRFPENIEIGGLLLCKAPVEMLEEKRRYYRQRAEAQMAAVDRNYLSESNPRMPLLQPERRTRTSRFSED